MSLARMLTRPITIAHRAASASVDDYGNPTPGTTSTTTTVGYLEQTQATEVTVGQDTAVSDWLLVLLPGEVIDANDRVTVDGVAYEVLGPPNRVRRPQTNVEHHAECRLRASVG